MRYKVSVGMIGLGTVGSGVWRILHENADLIRHRAGAPIEIVKIAVRDTGKDRGLGISPSLLTDKPGEIIEDPDIDIVVEVIGGYDPARDLILAAMAHGKHVVTANKGLLAEHGSEIHAAARTAGVMLGFEASVGGGLPIVKTLKEALAANRILSIYGIINGTCNYILTKMTDEGRSFEDVLREAQQAGYAEADPAFDVEGVDSAHKLAILVNLAFEMPIALQDIFTEGIRALRPLDIEFGKALGYRVKLLAIAKWHDGKVEARVHPTMVPEEYQIAKAGGVYNAIQVTGDACQDIMLYGRGAGSLPTGSAVVADLIDITRRMVTDQAGKVRLQPAKWELPIPQLQPIDSITSLYYLRLTARDEPGVLAQIAGVLGRHRISIAQMIQRGRKQGGSVPLVIMTHTALEHDVQKALVEIKDLACVTEPPVLIRVEGEEV
jgi:homoserine dehydrogenase